VIDTKKTPKLNKKTQVFTPKQLKRQGARRQPKAFEPLINKQIKCTRDPIVKRNHVGTKKERKHFIAKSKAGIKRAQEIIPFRIQQAHQQRMKDGEKEQNRRESKKTSF
jgi:hypothetical protein